MASVDKRVRANSNTISVFTGLGDGTFQAPVSYPAGAAPFRIALGTFSACQKRSSKLPRDVNQSQGPSWTWRRPKPTRASKPAGPAEKNPAAVALGRLGQAALPSCLADPWEGAGFCCATLTWQRVRFHPSCPSPVPR